MSYFGRLIIFSWILLFFVLYKVPAAQPGFASEEKAYVSHIIIYGDSAIRFPISSEGQNIVSNKKFILEYRNNNIIFELFPADTFEYQYFLKGFDREWSSWKKTSYKEYNKSSCR